MSDLESFGGLDGGEGLDPAALERFQEQMRDNAAHIAALQKAQAAQQKQEDKLVKIILKFIKNSQNKELVALVTQLLADNVPAVFILSIILLGNEDIQEEVEIILALPEEDMQRMEVADKAKKQAQGENTDNPDSGGTTSTLVVFGEDLSVLPLKVRIGIDLWAKNILAAGFSTPHKVLDAVYMPGTRGAAVEGDDIVIKDIVVRTAAFVVRQFSHENNVEGESARIYEFCHFLLKGIMEKIRFLSI